MAMSASLATTVETGRMCAAPADMRLAATASFLTANTYLVLPAGRSGAAAKSSFEALSMGGTCLV
jgi:hypothetical protein